MPSALQITHKDSQYYLETNDPSGIIFLSSGMGTSIRDLCNNKEDPIQKGSSFIAPLDAPKIVEQVHMGYINAGAQIITADTYCASYYRQNGDVELTEQFVTAASNIAENARKGVENAPLIAMSLTALEDCYTAEATPGAATLYSEHARNLALLEDHGDFTLAETLPTLRETQAIATLAKRPFVTSFTVAANGNLLDGNTMDKVVETILEPNALCLGIGVNCCSLEGAEKAVKALAEIYADKPHLQGKQIIAYPDGHKKSREENAKCCDNKEPEKVSPIELSETLNRFVQKGATAVGACCGANAEHTQAYVQKISQLQQKLALAG